MTFEHNTYFYNRFLIKLPNAIRGQFTDIGIENI